MGTKNFVELCDKLEASTARASRRRTLLEEMAAKGETFYGRFAPKKTEKAAA
jgi:3-hydroxyacyl-CoA dehydrogenase/enoyl-CoA hydratase/3-hydroxybutyryl-CoA epimerase